MEFGWGGWRNAHARQLYDVLDPTVLGGCIQKLRVPHNSVVMGSGDDEHPINAIECTPPIALLCEVTLDQLNTKAAEGLGACRIANQRNGFLPDAASWRRTSPPVNSEPVTRIRGLRLSSVQP